MTEKNKPPKTWTHKELCDLAVKWLKRSPSNNGHGCNIAVSEVKADHSGEIPDAIGFKMSCPRSSVLVEVKTSRSDFLADKKKPHRQQEHLGMGTYRYFMCPDGLISPEELPEKWGLLYVNNRGHIKPQTGPASTTKKYKEFKQALEDFKCKVNLENEWLLLVRLFNKVGDIEKLNEMVKGANRQSAYWEKEYREMITKHDEIATKFYKLRNKVEDRP